MQPAARPAGQAGQGGRAGGRAASRSSSPPSRCPTASRWATRACTPRSCRREVIADSVETRDARRALRRLRRPRRLRQEPPRHADGGGPPQPAVGVRLRRLDPARPPQRHGRSTSSSVFEAVGACAAGTITEDELGEIERRACPTEGTCAGMFTANTMASVGRGPRACRCPARRRRPPSTAAATTTPTRAGQAVVRLLELGITPAPDHDARRRSRTPSPSSTPSAARPTPCCTCWPSPTRPGSTLDARRLQPGRRAGAPHRRHEAGRQVPHDRPRPRRRRAGRDAAPARRRAAPRRLPHRDRPDHGREPGRASTRPRPTASSSTRSTRPIHTEGGIVVLTGSLAPKGSVVKVAGPHQGPAARSTARPACSTARRPPWRPSSPARSSPAPCSSSATRAPRAGPGMREMLAVTGALKGAGRGADCALDHRRSLLRRHVGLLHRPRRARGGRRRADRLRAPTATAS